MTWNTPNTWQQLTISLGSLAAGSRVLATANNPSSNTVEYFQIELRIRHTTAPTVDRLWLVHILPETSTTDTFSDGSASISPSVVNLSIAFPVRNVTTDQWWVSTPLILPPGKSQVLITNDTDTAAASTLTGGGSLSCAYRTLPRS